VTLIDRVISEYMAEEPCFWSESTPRRIVAHPAHPMSGGPENASSRPWSSLEAAFGGEQRQHFFVGPARAVGADRLDADMVGAGRPVLLDALPEHRLAAPGNIGVDKAVGAAAGEIV